MSGSGEMVVLGFSSGLVVFRLFPPTFSGFGDVLGGTGGGAPDGGGAGCDGLWSSSLSDVEGMTSPSSVSVSDASVVFLRFLTEIDRLFSSANGFLKSRSFLCGNLDSSNFTSREITTDRLSLSQNWYPFDPGS